MSKPPYTAVGPGSASPDPLLLVRQFDGFYSLLSSLVDRLRRGASDADDARTALVSYFEHQEDGLRPLGAGFLADIAQPARLVMAEMVDQSLGHDLEWSGRKAWSAKPLTTQLFGEIDGDAELRRNLDHLLSVDGPSEAQKALARVYLESLGLGLRSPFDAASLPDLEHRLFALIYPQAPAPDVPQLLFPEAYAHTVSRGRRTLLPTARPWWGVLMVAGLILLLLSWPIWRDATSELREALLGVTEVSTQAQSADSEGTRSSGTP